MTVRSLTVTAVTDSREYDCTTDSDKDPTVELGEGYYDTDLYPNEYDLLGDDSHDFSQSFDTAAVGAGKTLTPSGTITDGNSGNNYDVDFVDDETGVIEKRALTVSGIEVEEKVYDGKTDATLDVSDYELHGIVCDQTVTLNDSSYEADFNDKNVGEDKPVTVSGLGLSGTHAGNYSLTQPTGLTGTITKKELTLSGLEAQNKDYDGTTAATIGTPTLVGVVTADDAMDDVTLSGTAVGTFETACPGEDIEVTVSGLSLSGTDKDNYYLTLPDLSADIILAAVSLDIPLYLGWNLISVPVILTDDGEPSPGTTTFENVFAGVDIVSIYTWDGATQTYQSRSVTDVIDSSSAYWLRVDEDYTGDDKVVVEGLPVIPYDCPGWSAEIYEGWNLVGTSYWKAPVAVGNLDDEDTGYLQRSAIYYWDTQSRHFLTAASEGGVVSGRGYWMASSGEFTLSIAYPEA